MKKLISRSEDQTRKAGREYSAGLNENSIVAFFGELGSGKTQFIKGICSSLGVRNVVNSPTFIIVNEYSYDTGKRIYHFDLYRMKTTDEVMEIGFEDYIDKGMILIEWPELLENILPGNVKKVYLSHYGNDPNSRLIEFGEVLP